MIQPQKKSINNNTKNFCDPIDFIKIYRDISSKETSKTRERKQKEAEAIVEFVQDYNQSSYQNLATKHDLLTLETKLTSRIDLLEQRLFNTDQKIINSEQKIVNKLTLIITGLLTIFGLINNLI